MENENLVVLGIYNSRAEIERAVDEFKSAGFRAADISALLPSSESTKEFSHTKQTKAPEGASAGTATGVALGGTLGWLAGVGSLAIPGLGAFIAAGPIMAALAGAGVGAAVGGVSGALIGMGFPEYEAKRYEGYVRDGGYLLSVHCDNDDWRDLAKRTMEATGARDISSVSEARSESPEHVEEDKPRIINR